MLGGGANFGLGTFEHLLVATVNELRDLTADQIAGIGENLNPIVAFLLDRGGHVVLLQKHASLHARSLDQIESVITKPLDCFFVGALLNFGCQNQLLTNRRFSSAKTLSSRLPAYATVSFRCSRCP